MATSKIYIIYYLWPNTADNHAGMGYLAKQIKKTHPHNIRLIKVPVRWNDLKSREKKVWHLFIILFFKTFLNENDHIFFMEFLGNRSGDQADLAIRLKSKSFKTKMTGLVHLAPSNLRELYGNDSFIVKSLNALDSILVFGSSLEVYFCDLGFKDKVRKTYHYVDTNFYHPLIMKQNNPRLKVICLGSLKRNHNLLRKIIIQCPFADFDICMGEADLSELFVDIKNLTVHNYLPENALLWLMQQSDVSLSVLFDTVGSNVIVTSMATGLINVVSDVGSIRDYCSSNDSFLCSSIEDFTTALLKLSTDIELRKEFSKNALKKASGYDLKKFQAIFPELVS